MSSPSPKAQSVTAAGEPDGFEPPRCFRAETLPDGRTRLVVSVPQAELETVHLALLRALGESVGLLYVRLTDRQRGQLPAPERRVAVEVPIDRAVAALEARRELTWWDGRHQLWARGKYGDQVVLDELGLLYTYPDDVAFRAALGDVPERQAPGMDTRDYVRVSFVAEADAQETALWEELGMVPWR